MPETGDSVENQPKQRLGRSYSDPGIIKLSKSDLGRSDPEPAIIKLPKSDNICDACAFGLQNFQNYSSPHRAKDLDDLPNSFEFNLDSNLSSLQVAAEAGCVLCYAVWCQVPKDEEEASRGPGGKVRSEETEMGFRTYKDMDGELDAVEYILEYRRREFDATFWMNRSSVGADTHGDSDLSVSRTKASGHAYLSGNDIQESANCRRLWPQIQAWLQECEHGHKSCVASLQFRETALSDGAGWLPTRLLDCSAVDGLVRLVETNSDHVSGPYITLSHRWPAKLPASTTLSSRTRARFFAGIQKHQLPLAIQDAFTVALQLGIRYMWIDALCIMQDKHDLRDWERESALMHKVYSCSYLNISALAARNTLHSFLQDGNSGFLEPPWIELPYGVGSQRYDIQIPERWQEVSESHLNLRAWVFQERLLAPRVLHFARSQVYWQCQTSSASESRPKGLESWTRGELGDGMNLVKESILQRGNPDTERLYDVWSDLVDTYSKCKMTKPGDKLVAISGIANMIKSSGVTDQYIAGMWRHNLAPEMLWWVEEKAPGPRWSRLYRAPTFSWASMDCQVLSYRRPQKDVRFEIVSVAVENATQDVVGAVRSAEALIECNLQKLSLTPGGSQGFEMSVNNQQAHVHNALDEDVRFWDPCGRADLYCFPGAHHHTWGQMHMLLQLVDAKTATYRRIGLSQREPGWDDREDVIFLRGCPEESEFPCLSYKGGRHTIRLI